MCVCVYICASVCVYIDTYVCARAFLCVFIYTYMCSSVFIRIHTHTHAHARTHTHTHIHSYVAAIDRVLRREPGVRTRARRAYVLRRVLERSGPTGIKAAQVSIECVLDRICSQWRMCSG